MKWLKEAMDKYDCVVAYSTINERIKLWREIERACTTPKITTGWTWANKWRWKHQMEIKELWWDPSVSIKIYRIRRLRWWDKERAYKTPKRFFHEY